MKGRILPGSSSSARTQVHAASGGSVPAPAGVYAGLGERQKAITWLEKGIADSSVYISYIGVSPKYDSLRKDARFEDLLRRVGLSS